MENNENKKIIKDPKFKGYFEVDSNGEKQYIYPIIKRYYSCYDKTSKSYLGMFEANSDMGAIRLMEDTVKGGKGVIAEHPKDFRLDRIFIIDMRKAEIVDQEKKPIIEVNEIKEGTVE